MAFDVARSAQSRTGALRRSTIASTRPKIRYASAAADCKRQFQWFRRLGHEGIEARVHYRPYDVCTRARRVRDKPYPRPPPSANPPGQFEAIEHRHVEIDERHLGRTQIDFRQRMHCAVSNSDVVTKQRDDFGEGIGDILDIIDKENVCHSDPDRQHDATMFDALSILENRCPRRFAVGRRLQTAARLALLAAHVAEILDPRNSTA
jgi:hypothetical protein